MQAFQEVEIIRAFRNITTLPFENRRIDIVKSGHAAEDAAYLMGDCFEALGQVFYRRSLPFDMAMKRLWCFCVALATPGPGISASI